MLSWLNKYKYQFIIAILIIAVLYLFFQGIKKDHTLDLIKLEIKLKEDARQEIIKLRAIYENKEKELDTKIYSLHIKDSLIALQNILIDNRLNSLPKKYNEKATEINNLNDADLLDYFNKIEPQPNNEY